MGLGMGLGQSEAQAGRSCVEMAVFGV